MTHLPYRDFGQLYAAVSTREVDWTLASAASDQPMEKGGISAFWRSPHWCRIRYIRTSLQPQRYRA